MKLEYVYYTYFRMFHISQHEQLIPTLHGHRWGSNRNHLDQDPATWLGQYLSMCLTVRAWLRPKLSANKMRSQICKIAFFLAQMQ